MELGYVFSKKLEQQMQNTPDLNHAWIIVLVTFPEKASITKESRITSIHICQLLNRRSGELYINK